MSIQPQLIPSFSSCPYTWGAPKHPKLYWNLFPNFNKNTPESHLTPKPETGSCLSPLPASPQVLLVPM